MRLRSDIYVSALIRRVFSAGDFAAIECRGAEEAGAIFIRQRLRNGLVNLYCPAPQSYSSDEYERLERRFEMRLNQVDSMQADELIERERRFDSDIWVVELETDKIDGLFDVVTA